MKCPSCGLNFSDPTFVSQGAGTCPNCGYGFGPQHSDPSSRPIRRYIEDLKLVLLKPHSFFRRMPRNAGLAQPLAFALIAHWLGSALNYLWNTLSERSGTEAFEKWASFLGQSDQIDIISRNSAWIGARQTFMDWFWGMGSVIVDPFLTLVSIFVTSFFVFIGARIFVGRMSDAPGASGAAAVSHEVTYESAVRIIAYGTVASIFMAIPAFGSFIAMVYGIYISMVGAKEIYRIGTGRALLVVLFPKLLLMGIFLSAFAAIFLVAIKLFSMFFTGGF